MITMKLDTRKLEVLLNDHLSKKEGKKVRVHARSGFIVGRNNDEKHGIYIQFDGTVINQDGVLELLQEIMPQYEITHLKPNFLDEDKTYLSGVTLALKEKDLSNEPEYVELDNKKIRKIFNAYLSQKENQKIKANPVSMYFEDPFFGDLRRTLVIDYYKKEIINGRKVEINVIIPPNEIVEILSMFYPNYELKNYTVLFDDEAHHYVRGLSFELKEKELKRELKED